MEIETPESISQPGMAERAIDTATDASRTITELSAALCAAIEQLSQAIATARQPGKPLSTISAITREAPLASLFVAFLFGVAVGRRALNKSSNLLLAAPSKPLWPVPVRLVISNITVAAITIDSNRPLPLYATAPERFSSLWRSPVEPIHFAAIEALCDRGAKRPAQRKRP